MPGDYDIDIKIIRLLVEEADRLGVNRTEYIRSELSLLNVMAQLSNFDNYDTVYEDTDSIN